MKKLLIFFLIIIALIFSLLAFVFYQANKVVENYNLVTAKLAGHDLLLEVVSTPDSITQGLSGRDAIGNGNEAVNGMLFVLPKRTVPTFWMKDMKFDIDIIWIDGDKIIDMDKGVPKPSSNLKLEELPRYSPVDQVDKVLELPAGKADELGFQVGDKISLNSNR